MKTDTSGTHFSNVLLTGAILLAQVDMHGLVDYSLKAAIGGAVWLGYKIIAERMERKRKSHDKQKD
ncbi:MAG: hypothetical protein JST82_11215 [Bacteroidetes bacterium]|nr:hypothetical protein [Bacteroidota bacterium]